MCIKKLLGQLVGWVSLEILCTNYDIGIDRINC